MIVDAHTLKDAGRRVLDYLVAVNEEFSPPLASKVPLDEYCKKIMSLSNVFVDETDGVIRGMIVFYTNDHKDKRSYCALLSVASDYRGFGISTGLLKLFIGKSKDEGMIAATCHTNNPVALKLYTTFGFKEIGRERSHEEGYMDRLFLEKIL